MTDPQVAALKAAIKELAARYGIRLAVLFGSRARREATKLSDVDVAVLCDCDVSELAEELERRGISADVVDLREVPPVLACLIAVDGVLVYGDEWDFHEFRSRALREYFDFKRILEPHTARARSYVGV